LVTTSRLTPAPTPAPTRAAARAAATPAHRPRRRCRSSSSSRNVSVERQALGTPPLPLASPRDEKQEEVKTTLRRLAELSARTQARLTPTRSSAPPGSSSTMHPRRIRVY